MGDKDRIEVKIAHIAARQQRQVTRAQLLALGMAPTSITRFVSTGRLHREHPGVYSVGCPAVTPLERAMAAVLACGPSAVLSHASALTLWGIWKRWEIPFHVTLTGDRRPKGIKVHRVKCIDRRDVSRRDGTPVTTLPRTLLDCAPLMTAKSLNRAINNARLDHQVHPSALLALVRRYPSHPGRRLVEAVLGSATERPTRSAFEDTFPSFCERYGLPTPQMNAVVCGYEVDALFAQEKVIVELDGWSFHSSRTSFETDRGKDADTLAAGYATLRITWARYQQAPDQEAARLHTILANRRTSPPPARRPDRARPAPRTDASPPARSPAPAAPPSAAPPRG